MALKPAFLSLLLALGACSEAEPPAPAAPAPAAATTPAAAAPAAPPVAPASPLSLERYTQFLREISDDRLEGRGPGTAGEKRTIEYLTAQLKEMGVAPGPDGSYTQAVPMVEITGEVTRPLKFVHGERSLELKLGEQFVASSHVLEDKVAVEDAELVYVGYGVVAPEYQWDDYAGIDVKGKIVVTLINDPGFGSGNEQLFKGRAMTYYGRWTYKYEEAARRGAAGVLIVHDTAGASYGWDVVRNSWSGPEYGLPAGPNSTPPLRMQGWLSGEAASALFEQGGLDLAALRKAADQPGFKPVAIPGRASVEIANRVRKTDSYNVIGVIEGSERPEERVIYTAHWDHLGKSFGLPDGIFNGAIDNGTGVAGLLELARTFAAGEKPKRSLVFLFVTLEESGLLGSRYYVENPLYPLAQTVAVVNMDAMHVIGPTRDMIVIGHGNSELEDLLKARLEAAGRIMRPEATPENGFYYRSDHFNFAKAGVPALYPKTGIDHVEKGAEYGQQVISDYNANRYHKPGDQFDPNWDLSGMLQDLELIRQVGAELANGMAWPNWYEGTEFRAKRDAMRQ